MNKNSYFALWGGMFVICAGLGFIPKPEGAAKWLLVTISVLFFLPPAMLLRYAMQANDRDTVKLIRNLSLLSLGITVVTLILNFASLIWSEAVGNALYALLIVVSCPMICAQYWLLSMFLWACLLMASIRYLRKKVKSGR